MSTTSISRRDALRVGAAMAGLAMVSAAPRVNAAQDTTLTFWNTLYPSTDPNDKTKKLEEFYIYGAISRFEESHPGVTIETENLPSGPEMFTKYRTASVAQNGPDVTGMWSGSYMLNLKDFLEPLGPYFTPEERSRITGWEAVAEDFDPEADEIYGVPAASDCVTCIFYNRDLLSAADVDPATSWPQNFDEFTALLETVQASGTTPLVLEGDAIVWQVLSYWLSQTVGGATGIDALISGVRDFSDPALVTIVENWQTLSDYTIGGAETMDGAESAQLFFQEQAAMTTSGFWVINNAREALGDKLGMVKIPDFSQEALVTDGGIGGPGAAFVVSNYSPNKELAVEFVKFLMSPEEQAQKAESGEGGLLNVTDVDVSEYYEDPLKLTQQEWATEPSTLFWTDNIYPADLTTEMKAQSQLAWTGQISAEEFMQRLDDTRNELLGA